MLAARNREKLDAVARAMPGAGRPDAGASRRTSPQEPQCRALVDQAVQQFGRIDALVNNAGVSAQALFADVRPQDLHWYEKLMKVNLWGSVWCTHAALPHLKASQGQHRGRVVAGRAGRRARPHRLQRHQVRHDRILRGAAGRTQEHAASASPPPIPAWSPPASAIAATTPAASRPAPAA